MGQQSTSGSPESAVLGKWRSVIIGVGAVKGGAYEWIEFQPNGKMKKHSVYEGSSSDFYKEGDYKLLSPTKIHIHCAGWNDDFGLRIKSADKIFLQPPKDTATGDVPREINLVRCADDKCTQVVKPAGPAGKGK